MAIREPGAGELNRRVKLRLRSDQAAPDMGLSSVFTDEKKRWAKIEPVGAATYSAGLQVDAKVTHRIIIYRLPGLSDAHEVVHGAKLYRIRRVADMNGGHRFTMLEVEELGPEKDSGGVYG